MLQIVWRLRAKPDRLQEFTRHHGAHGVWTELFRRSADYRGTVMWQDVADPLGFLIVDRWSSQQAVTKFRKEFMTEYEELDRHCESLTLEEHLLGVYEDEEDSNLFSST